MKMLRTILVVLTALSLTLVACKDDEKKGDEKKGDEKKVAEMRVPGAPATADGVVKESLKAFAEKEPGKIYYMLPDSYRKDIQDLKDMALAKLDKETVDNALKAFDKVVAGLEKHKDKLIEGDLPLPLPKEAIGVAVDRIVALWAVLNGTGLGTYDGWKVLDMGQFLLEHGKMIVTAGLEVAGKTEYGAEVGKVTAMVAGVSVDVKKTEAEETILTVVIDQDEEEMKFVKVEGKWIPEDLQNDWTEGVAEARKKIEEGLKEYEGQKDMFKAMSGTLVAAATAFEENGDLNQLMGALGGPVPAK